MTSLPSATTSRGRPAAPCLSTTAPGVSSPTPRSTRRSTKAAARSSCAAPCRTRRPSARSSTSRSATSIPVSRVSRSRSIRGSRADASSRRCACSGCTSDRSGSPSLPATCTRTPSRWHARRRRKPRSTSSSARTPDAWSPNASRACCSRARRTKACSRNTSAYLARLPSASSPSGTVATPTCAIRSGG